MQFRSTAIFCMFFCHFLQLRTTMLGIFACVFLLAGAALCRPSIPGSAVGNYSLEPLSPEDREWLTHRVRMTRTAHPAGFQHMYVSQRGQIVENTRPASGDYIQVIGSPRTPRSAMYVAARTLGKMFRHSRSSTFNHIARKPGSGLGLFTAEESLTVFPEAAYLRGPPECKGRCNGSCSSTCTFDGRKYTSIPGITIGARSYVTVDNVLCTDKDIYDGRDNIVVHEFAHSVIRLALTIAQKHMWRVAYNNAKQQALWAPGSYAMSTNAEYFAEGTGAYFLVNFFYSSGGMTNCPGGHKCRTEQEVRQFLHDHDPQLWSLLTDVYNQGDAALSSGLTICPTT